MATGLGAEGLERVLAHYGVKGMQWGRRKASGSNSGHSEDAKRAADYKARAKKGGPNALSTKELQDLVTRMNLEKQYSTLGPPTKGAATKKFIADILLQVGKQQATKLVADQLAKQIAKKL